MHAFTTSDRSVCPILTTVRWSDGPTPQLDWTTCRWRDGLLPSMFRHAPHRHQATHPDPGPSRDFRRMDPPGRHLLHLRDVLAERDWFGIVLGCLLVTSGMAGIWRTLRLGVVIGEEGVRVRGFDSRDQVTPWSAIQSVDCVQIDVRGGLPLYAPVLRLGDDAMPLSALGSYSRQDAERKVAQLRSLKASVARS